MSTADRHRHRPPRVIARRGDEQHRRRPERLRHQRHVAGEPDVLLPVRRARVSGRSPAARRATPRPRSAPAAAPPPSPRSARSRGRAGSAARPRAAAARSPGSRPRAPAPRYRHGSPPARSPPRRGRGRYWSASGVGAAGTATGAAASFASISPMIAVFQARRCTCQTPSQTSTVTPRTPKRSGAIIRRVINASATFAGALQGQSAESGKPVASKGASRTSPSPCAVPASTQAPSCSAKASSSLRLRIEEPEEARPRAHRRAPASRSGRSGGFPGSRISQTQSGTSSIAGRVRKAPHALAPPAGEVRHHHVAAEVQLRLDGEDTSRPGRRRHRRTGRPSRTASLKRRPRVTRRRARVEVQRAAHQLGDHVRQARRGRPGRSPAGGSSSRACSGQDPQM